MSSYTEPINLNIFVLPSQSFATAIAGASQEFVARAAVSKVFQATTHSSLSILSPVLESRANQSCRMQVLSTLATTGTTLTGTIYYPIAQAGTVAPKIAKTTFPLTFEKTVGAYKVVQGTVSVPLTVAQFAGFRYVDVKLGTTQTSPKVDVGLFGACSDITTC